MKCICWDLLHRATQLDLWEYSLVFAFFFMQADLFSKMYKKKFTLKTINVKWDIVSLFIISAGGQSRKLFRMYLFHIYFSCLLFVFFPFTVSGFLWGGFVYVMPLASSSTEHLHCLQQMEISQYKVCRGSSGCVVNGSLQERHWKLWAES